MATQVINDYLYLIDMTDIASFIDISSNIKTARINAQIRNCQDLDLVPFFGDAFYYDFISQFDDSGALKNTAPEIIQQLFNGCIYNDFAGNPIQYQGMKPALVYLAFARFAEIDPVQFTSTGAVQKSHDLAEPVSSKTIAEIATRYRSIANGYLNKIEKFMLINKEYFPLWRPSEKNRDSRQPGPRLRGVDRTKYNRGYGYDRGFNDFDLIR